MKGEEGARNDNSKDDNKKTAGKETEREGEQNAWLDQERDYGKGRAEEDC